MRWQGEGWGALIVLTADNAACYLRSSDNRIRVICPRYLRQITPSLPSLMLSEADNAKFCVIWRASLRYLRQITPSSALSEADNAKFCVIWRASLRYLTQITPYAKFGY